MVKSEDFVLFLVAIGFTAIGVLQLNHVPSIWAQYFMGVIVFLAAMTCTIVWNTHIKEKEEI